MTRPAKVIIDLAALQHNLSRVKQLAPDSRIIAIIKADGYGHGLVRVAKALIHADAFGVACLEEAEQLRLAGVKKAIVLLEGVYEATELSVIDELRLDIVVHEERQVQMLEGTQLQTAATIWLKLDSGMHRLGFPLSKTKEIWRRLDACKSTDQINLMTHFAAAGERNKTMTMVQLDAFVSATKDIKAECSIANSAGVLDWKQSHVDWVRPGLMLYGISPFEGSQSSDYDLQPVMTFCSELISIKHLKQGDPVGYGAAWTCPEDMPIGIVAAGYGDGFPRHAASGTPIVVNGQRTQIIGNASMDMLTVDLRPLDAFGIGCPVELWGKELAVAEVAKHAGTIPYELLCSVRNRLNFVEQHA